MIFGKNTLPFRFGLVSILKNLLLFTRMWFLKYKVVDILIWRFYADTVMENIERTQSIHCTRFTMISSNKTPLTFECMVLIKGQAQHP